MNTNDLELFIAVAKLGSFSKAAESFDTRRALVSRRIGELESQLGTPLFVRTTRAMSLTPSGEQFLEQVEPILNQLHNATHAIKNRTEVQGKLRIGLLPFADKLLADQIADFSFVYPKVQLDVFTLGGGYRDITRLGLDFALEVGQLDDSSFIAKKLISFTQKLYASPAYLKRNPPITSIDDLTEHRLLGSRLGTGIVEPQWLFTTAKTDVKYKITSDFSSLYSFCLAGAGVALLPYGIVSKDVKNGQLVNILPELETEETDVYLVYASRKHMTSSAKLFIEHIQQALTDLKRLNELEKNRKY
ncbi:LysR family transcriptional regulator [Shewanella waksmanii]|uniref:LysR family transcriptional regulator n=1 Tax=Shewanella waksmanii TaxID=213783 RepID=UPI0004B1EFCC|nr:LysR family transcriptional regulator [Shewanella waksmanii]